MLRLVLGLLGRGSTGLAGAPTIETLSSSGVSLFASVCSGVSVAKLVSSGTLGVGDGEVEMFAGISTAVEIEPPFVGGTTCRIETKYTRPRTITSIALANTGTARPLHLESGLESVVESDCSFGSDLES